MLPSGALADLVFLSLHDLLGPTAFVGFASVAFAGGVYCFLQLPETKGRTLAQVQELLSSGGSAPAQGATSLQGVPDRPAPSEEEMIRPGAVGAAGRNHAAAAEARQTGTDAGEHSLTQCQAVQAGCCAASSTLLSWPNCLLSESGQWASHT